MIVLAVIVALAFLVIPAFMPSLMENSLMGGVLDLALCKGHEDLTISYTAGIPGTALLGCFNPINGFVRDTSSLVYMVGAAGSIALLPIGVAILLRGHRQQVQQFTKRKNSPSAAYLDANSRFVPEQQGMSMASRSLADRLAQLENAFDSGLVTEAEYEVKRKEIIRDL
jgi:hypothetical protein